MKIRKYRICSVLPLLLCILSIWSNSLQNAESSGARSGRVTEIVNEVLDPKEPITEHTVRKSAHLFEFAMEGMCVMLVLWAYGVMRWTHVGNICLVGVLTALTDELIQLRSSGRASSVADVWIDLAGFVAGAVLFVMVWAILRYAKRLWHRRGKGNRIPKNFSHNSLK
ncbi:MAG: VanZ family protein [Candidatus Gastranaerophilales bacterium]|nr:VanZ family protein [Candidatus Gastranaerophilales bacterium]MCM1528354.1 VanZ family protein [Bacteroides sp.]